RRRKTNDSSSCSRSPPTTIAITISICITRHRSASLFFTDRTSNSFTSRSPTRLAPSSRSVQSATRTSTSIGYSPSHAKKKNSRRRTATKSSSGDLRRQKSSIGRRTESLSLRGLINDETQEDRDRGRLHRGL